MSGSGDLSLFAVINAPVNNLVHRSFPIHIIISLEQIPRERISG